MSTTAHWGPQPVVLFIIGIKRRHKQVPVSLKITTQAHFQRLGQRRAHVPKSLWDTSSALCRLLPEYPRPSWLA
eukprot:1158843-Pelagomonas_calceolata.AAC.5